MWRLSQKSQQRRTPPPPGATSFRPQGSVREGLTAQRSLSLKRRPCRELPLLRAVTLYRPQGSVLVGLTARRFLFLGRTQAPLPRRLRAVTLYRPQGSVLVGLMDQRSLSLQRRPKGPLWGRTSTASTPRRSPLRGDRMTSTSWTCSPTMSVRLRSLKTSSLCWERRSLTSPREARLKTWLRTTPSTPKY